MNKGVPWTHYLQLENTKRFADISRNQTTNLTFQIYLRCILYITHVGLKGEYIAPTAFLLTLWLMLYPG